MVYVTESNLQEAVGLFLEGENLEELGLSPNPNLLIIMEEPVNKEELASVS